MNITLGDADIQYLKNIGNEQVTIFLDKKIVIREKKIKKAKDRKLKKQALKLEKRQKRKNFLKYKAEEFRGDLIRKITPSENKFKALLNYLKVSYEFQKIIYYDNTFYIVDFYIPKLNIVFEIDGGYHTSKEQMRKDANRTRILKREGISKVYRFSNSEVDNNTEIIKRLEKIL